MKIRKSRRNSTATLSTESLARVGGGGGYDISNNNISLYGDRLVIAFPLVPGFDLSGYSVGTVTIPG